MAARPPSPKKEVLPKDAQRLSPCHRIAGANASSAGMLLPSAGPTARRTSRKAPPNNPSFISSKVPSVPCPFYSLSLVPSIPCPFYSLSLVPCPSPLSLTLARLHPHAPALQRQPSEMWRIMSGVLAAKKRVRAAGAYG